MTPAIVRATLAAALLATAACQAAAPELAPHPATSQPGALPTDVNGVLVTKAPYDQVHINWKHRLDEAYVFVEHRGDYRQVGPAMSRLIDRVREAGIVPRGPLFALFYDDPGEVPTEHLRARICCPVDVQVGEGYGLGFDVLPSTTVVYAVAGGYVGQVPRTYPRLFEYMGARNWSRNGPIREVYLNLDGLPDPSALLTEVQVPWTPGG